VRSAAQQDAQYSGKRSVFARTKTSMGPLSSALWNRRSSRKTEKARAKARSRGREPAGQQHAEQEV